MPQPFPEIREPDAPSEIAALYDDLRRTTALPLVNLIYRHLATLPGVLPWVWSLVRPLVVSGAADAARVRVAAALDVPDLSVPALDGTGRAEAHEIGRVLDVYNRGNLLNLVTLGAVRIALDRPEPRAGDRIAATGAARPTVEPLPALPRLAELSPETAFLVRSLAAMHGAAAGAGVVPSLYLHLAHWPAFLDAVRQPLRDLADAGVLRASCVEARRLADREAATLASTMTVERPPPKEQALALRGALATFTTHVIPEMIPVGFVLRRSLPGCGRDEPSPGA